jgi:RHS repeat-associated protein
MLKICQISRTCRKKHKSITTTNDSITTNPSSAHNAQAQRVFKTAPLFALTNPDPAAPQSTLDAFTAFFESLWSPVTGTVAAAQKAGMSYVYDETGTLIADTLAGGASTTWGQSARYIYLPTASGPMPVAAIYGTKHYAVQSDHLNTPRRLIQSDGQVAWQWSYSAFGDEKPTIAKNRFANADLNQSFGTTTVPAVTFNLRYPGQYFDQESNLHYNWHRSYCANCGRYTQADPIDLQGGWNRFAYAELNPLSIVDPEGLAGLYNDGSVSVNAYPGSPAGGNEHARQGPGQNYHVHIRDSNGREVRMSTETWKPLTPQDQKIYDQSKAIRNFCDGLSSAEKKFYDRVNRQVFHTGHPTINQTIRLGGWRGRISGRSQE